MSQKSGLGRANRRTAVMFAGIACFMLGVAAYSPTLYRIFCQVTGYGGYTQRADAAPGAQSISDVEMSLRFDASTASDMPWTFKPAQREITLRPGETKLAFYTAHNPTSLPVAGTASFNVTPLKAGYYFNKIECFCFTEQILQPGESVEMPVTFFIDPEFLDDVNTRDLRSITLSYTFHRTEIDETTETAAIAAPMGAASGLN